MLSNMLSVHCFLIICLLCQHHLLTLGGNKIMMISVIRHKKWISYHFSLPKGWELHVVNNNNKNSNQASSYSFLPLQVHSIFFFISKHLYLTRCGFPPPLFFLLPFFTLSFSYPNPSSFPCFLFPNCPCSGQLFVKVCTEGQTNEAAGKSGPVMEGSGGPSTCLSLCTVGTVPPALPIRESTFGELTGKGGLVNGTEVSAILQQS